MVAKYLTSKLQCLGHHRNERLDNIGQVYHILFRYSAHPALYKKRMRRNKYDAQYLTRALSRGVVSVVCRAAEKLRVTSNSSGDEIP